MPPEEENKRFLMIYIPYGKFAISEEELDMSYLRDHWGGLFTSINYLDTTYPLSVSEWLSCAKIGDHCSTLEHDLRLVRIQ